MSRFESLQACHTLAGRDLGREIIPMPRSEDLGLMVWSPLTGGLLSGEYAGGNTDEAGSRHRDCNFPSVNRPRAEACIEAMRTIAESHGVSVAQVALAWLLNQPQVSRVIIGAKQLREAGVLGGVMR